MGDPSLEIQPDENGTTERLDSWKEIAAYLNRDVTTVQRWEKREGMPVHRHLHDKRGSVYASRLELDAWIRSRRTGGQEDEDPLSETTAGLTSVSPRFSMIRSRKIWIAAALSIMALAGAAWFWAGRTELFWRNPIRDARFQTVTDFGGSEEAGAVSRDGHFIAFLSDRDGKMDVWVTQVGSGQFHNLTHGAAPEITNPSLRTLSFSPDGSLVTYWARTQDASQQNHINVWAIPTLGGEPRPYLEGAAEFDWSGDGTRLAYHTSAPGDPLFLSEGRVQQDGGRPIFTAPPGLHAHFPVWSPDEKYIYFVQGSVPDKLDIWRIPSRGGPAERITSHNTSVLYPIMIDRRTLLYLATDPDGAGPWLYSIDVNRRIAHRLTPGLDRYTSLAISADRRRIVATLASPQKTLWRLQISGAGTQTSAPVPVALTTRAPSRPRLGPGFLLYVSSTSKGESLWRLTGATSEQLWSGQDAQFVGGPALSPDGTAVAFSVRQRGETQLLTMNTDGTNARMICHSLNLQGDPAWAPDGKSIASAALESGVPHLFRIPLDGGASTPLTGNFSLDPGWSPDGGFVVYSGEDVGTTFVLRAVTNSGADFPIPGVTLTRGARHIVFVPGGHSVVVLRGDIEHKNLWRIDLDSGAQTQLTDLPAGFDVRDFSLSPDGQSAVVERTQQHSDVVMMDLPLRQATAAQN